MNPHLNKSLQEIRDKLESVRKAIPKRRAEAIVDISFCIGYLDGLISEEKK